MKTELENSKHASQDRMAMSDARLPSPLFLLITLVALVNAVICVANAVEDGGMLRSLIPAVCWSIAAMVWMGSGLRKGEEDK